MDTILFFFYAVAYSALLIWALTKQVSWNYMAFLYLVLLGLVYDNTILGSGRYIGEGALLENLSWIRYWTHAFFTPTLVLFSWGALNKAGVNWARKKYVFYGALVYTAALIAIEVFTEIMGMELMAEREYGVLSYTSAGMDSGPPLMILFVLAVLLAAGVILWKQIGWKWMLIGTLFMTAGSIVEIPVASSAITNAFELILLFTLAWTKIHLETKEHE